AWIPLNAGSEKQQLTADVDVQIPLRVKHAVVVPKLTGKVKDHFGGTDRFAKHLGVSDIERETTDVANPLAQVLRITSAALNARIDNRNVESRLQQG
ncbi:MAG: hypothetical protein M3Z32_00615, partial [Acidobacteriota bacterium]|nr:hypothetical protein [Acidobacteriota bacterium]